MKKIVVLLIVLFLCCFKSFAADNLSFIYINGSNNNDQKMKNWYEKGVKKLHPVMRKKFLTNSYIKKAYKNIGGLNIKEEPVIFFWGYDSKNDLEFVKDHLEISRMVSSAGAFVVRNMITQYLHDAIWVQKSHNMLPILDDLNNQVIRETQAGNSVILYGYSAGTFVTYQYMLNKLRFIDIKKLLSELNADAAIVAEAQKLPLNKTCLSALSIENGKIGTMSDAGHLVLNGDEEELQHNLKY